jgi:hypothetical protein
MATRFIKQIAKLKEENANLKQQTRECGAVHRMEEASSLIPRKRRRAQDSDSEYEDSDYPCDHERARVNSNSDIFSREQIRDVLGGFDRGWGSTRYAFVSPSHAPSGLTKSLAEGAVQMGHTCTIPCLT